MASSERDYEFVRAAAQSRSANRLPAVRTASVERQLKVIAQDAGAADIESLASLMRRPGATHLHNTVAEAMTIKETSFFRDGAPFTLLRNHILPRLLKQRAEQRRLRVWSAAASTGQEAYSLAMLLREHFPQTGKWDVQIVATDISSAACAYAQRGRYTQLEVSRGLPPRLLSRYFASVEDQWEVSPVLREMVTFQRMNLCQSWKALPKFDLILLRNVLLYFPTEDQERVLAGAYRQLNDGGALLLGATEQAEDSSSLFQVEFAEDCYFYRPVHAVKLHLI